MKGIVKLKVPQITVEPKLFIITLVKDGKQKRFSKVNICLGKAIESCYCPISGYYGVSNYVTHLELSINEINNLFKHFNP